MTKNSKYILGFSSGALLSEAFAAVLENCSDYKALSSGKVKPEFSIIRVNSEKSQKKYLSEILKRLKNVPSSVLEMYIHSNDVDKRVIEFFAVCNTYSIIHEFMIEIVRNKWLNLDFELESYDFKLFLLHKLTETESIDQVSELSISKLAQVALKMLKELGMYDGKVLKKIETEQSVLKAIHDTGNAWFLDVLLLTDEEKKEIKKW